MRYEQSSRSIHKDSRSLKATGELYPRLEICAHYRYCIYTQPRIATIFSAVSRAERPLQHDWVRKRVPFLQQSLLHSLCARGRSRDHWLRQLGAVTRRSDRGSPHLLRGVSLRSVRPRMASSVSNSIGIWLTFLDRRICLPAPGKGRSLNGPADEEVESAHVLLRPSHPNGPQAASSARHPPRLRRDRKTLLSPPRRPKSLHLARLRSQFRRSHYGPGASHQGTRSTNTAHGSPQRWRRTSSLKRRVS